MAAGALRLAFHPEADDDFESIFRYGIETWGEVQVQRYGARILDLIDSLCHYPRMGRLHEDLVGETWSMAVGHHRVIYQVEADRLVIVRIVHERAAEIDDLV